MADEVRVEMYQGVQQNRCLLWHTGWNEMFRKRKKRRKRNRVINTKEGENGRELVCLSVKVKYLNIFHRLPQILYLILILMPILLPEQNSTKYANCQMMLGHPRSKIHRNSNYLSPTFYHPVRTLRPKDPMYNNRKGATDDQMNKNDIKQATINSYEKYNLFDENIKSYSTMPTSQEKQKEMLRKFSSTMLLETLFRKPSKTNRSPFPSLPLPILDDFAFSKSQIKPESPKDSPSYLDVSTTNRTTTTTDTAKNRSDIFNPSSLNYLVDKLLSVEPFKHESDTHLKRPESRYKSPYEANSSVVEPSGANERYSPPNLSSKTPSMTLDMLIKNEYDSRVEPMLKSLLDQQTLSTPSKNTELNLSTNSKIWPINHKVDESLIEDTLSNSTESIPTTTSLNKENTEVTDGEAAVAFEDFEDDDDGHDEDVEKDEIQTEKKDLNDTQSNTLTNDRKEEDSSSKRLLQNVPPYQFSNNLDFKDSFKPIKSVNRHREVPVTTSSTTDPIINNADSRGDKKESGFRDKAKSSLVFSDGGDEAERANKRKVELIRNDKASRINSFGSRNSNNWNERKDSDQMINKTSSPSSTEKPGDSFLLQQLFTTIDPLSELSNKLKEQASVRDPTEISPNNPLIYKGYVGKDDYLLSSTARDWSRPINMTENPPTTLYKYANNQPITSGLPTQPPSVPFNYSENQPVTNAQSVPTMVIPTSDPPEITTQYSIKYDANNRKSGGHSTRIVSPKPPLNGYFYQNPASISSDKTQTNSNTEIRKYSYQVPERQPNKNQVQYPINRIEQNSTSITMNNSKPYVNELSESEYFSTRNKNKSSISSKPMNNSDRNWSPSKIVPSEILQHNNQRRRQQTLNHDKAILETDSLMNSSSPMFVPMVDMKTTMTLPINNTERAKNMISNLDVNDIDNNNFSVSPISSTEAPSIRVSNNGKENGFADSGFNQKNTSHKGRWNVQRKKSRVPSPATLPPETWSTVDQPMGDIDTDTDIDQEVKNLDDGQPKRVRRPTLVGQNVSHERPSNKEITEILEDDVSESEEDNEDQKNAERDRNQKSNSRRVNKGTVIGTKRNQTRKATQISIKHEPAGSEISLTGLDKNIQLNEGKPRNFTTNRFSANKPKQSSRPVEAILIGDTDSSSFPSTTSVVQSSIPSSFGSTIIPSNNNFFGEASSESPALENTIASLNPNIIGKINKAPASAVEDVQRINDAQSTPQHTTSTTIFPNETSKIPTSTVQTPTKQDENSSTTSSPGQTKPSTKSSNDRLAFILIGGSCALSVVCLVLAAMSMRCQDMCDDYRSLRNAERAALKLQKHRLRYTKNHQINRYNHDRSFTGAGHTLIEDLNAQNHLSDESELDQLRNSKFLNNRSIQFNDPTQKSNNTDLNMWNSSNCQLPLSACINKELQSCKCSTCLNQRWLYPDELLTNSKHLSWLHPYYYMQHHPRLRPLFGAASSVGTFFPRRLEDQSFHGGVGGAGAGSGSTDAQILIDSQPPHSCNVVDPRGITSSKSILHKGKKIHPKHDVNAFREAINVGCNNPEHNHSHHLCHNHHHRMISDASASEESELTLDESVICDNAKCPNHRHLKLGHLKSSSHDHHPLWKPGSIRKSNPPSHSHHHHHHSHHHQQQLSGSDGSSIAQCTCSRDKQPLLLSNNGRHNSQRTSHKHASKHDSKQQAKRDKLVWSTNRDRLI